MAINAGVNIAKSVSFAVLDIPPGVDIAKAVAFAVLDTVYPPIWPAYSFPNGTLTIAYSASIDLTPATPTVTFTLDSGTLPNGLSISNAGDLLTLSGTPTVANTFNFVLKATNSYGSQTKAFTVTIGVITPGGCFTFIS